MSSEMSNNSANKYDYIDDYIGVDGGVRNQLINMNSLENSGNRYELPTRFQRQQEKLFTGNISRQKSHLSTASRINWSNIKSGLLILFILLTFVFAFLFFKEQLRDEKLTKKPKYTSVMRLDGWHDDITNSTIIYNSMEKSCKNCNMTLPGTVSRELATDHSELVNPYMLIFGRYKDGIRVLNPEEDKLIECKFKLPSKVQHHGSAIINNELYIFGGTNISSLQPTNKCFKLDKSHKWIEVASMKENKTTITKCSVVFNSEIWVFGGWTNTLHRLKTVEKYNPEANTWTYMREMIEERSWCAASIIDGKIYVSGGHQNSIEVYDPVKNEWEIFSNDMPHEGYLHSAVVDESSLIIIGGFQNKTYLDEVWKINVEDPKKEWKKMPNLNQRRSNIGAAKLKNKIIVIGEKPGIEIFDGNKWTIRSSRDLGPIGPIVLLTKQKEVDLLKNVCF